MKNNIKELQAALKAARSLIDNLTEDMEGTSHENWLIENADNCLVFNQAFDVDTSRKEKPLCEDCKGSNLLFDAFAIFNTETQSYEINNTFDECFCSDCDKSIKVFWEDLKENEGA